MQALGVVDRDCHHRARRPTGRARRLAWRIAGDVVRPEDHVHLPALAHPGNRRLVGAKRDRRLSGVGRHHRARVRADGIRDEAQRQAVGDVGVGREGDRVVIGWRSRRVTMTIGSPPEGGGRGRVAEQESQLPLVLERVPEVRPDEPEPCLGPTERRSRRLSLVVRLAGQLAHLARGPHLANRRGRPRRGRCARCRSRAMTALTRRHDHNTDHAGYEASETDGACHRTSVAVSDLRCTCRARRSGLEGR